MAPDPDATDLLLGLREEGITSDPRLDPLIYDEVRRLAQKIMSRERRGHTLQPTALANEAYLRLIDQSRTQPADRRHFLVLAARAMRRILIDHARARKADKRGGGWDRVPLSEGNLLEEGSTQLDILSLEAALEELSQLDARKASIVELRFFAGLSTKEAAECLGVSTGTISEDWQAARAWLGVRLGATG